MKSNPNDRKQKTPDPSPDRVARDIVRRALKASLATLDRVTGHPYASLVTVATDPAGVPLVLISQLALHTQNIAADPRASLLFDASGSGGDPLAGGRVTVIGRMERTAGSTDRRRFLARQPSAEMYAGFPDFAFYRLVPERAHFVGGFGRIVALEPKDIAADVSDAGALFEAEADIVSHMNDDHAAAVELYATALAGGQSGPWLMSGLDPEGCDLVCSGDAVRIGFATRVTTPGLARQELARLAAEARASRRLG